MVRAEVMYEPSALKLFQDKCKLSQAVQVDKQIGAEGALCIHSLVGSCSKKKTTATD